MNRLALSLLLLFFVTPCLLHAQEDSSQAGTHWVTVSTGLTWTATTMWFIDSSRGWIQTEGQLYATNDGGRTWSKRGDSLDVVRPVFVDNLYGWSHIGIEDHLWKTTDGGSNWFPLPNNVRIGGNWRFFTRDTGYVLGFGGVTTTFDGGQTWNPTQFVSSTLMHDVARFDADHLLAVGEAEDFHPPDNPSITVYGASTFYTKDAGHTWARIPYVHLGISANSIVTFNYHTAVMCGQNSNRVCITRDYSLFEGSLHCLAQSGGGLIGVGGYGQIKRSLDTGRTWSVIPSGTGEYLRQVQFTDSLHGYIIGDNSTFLVASDGGAS